MRSTPTTWLELNTTNAESAMDFYGKTLGWHFEPVDSDLGERYWIAKANNKPVASLFELSDEEERDIPPHWMTYMTVNDIRMAHDRARLAGCEVIRPPLDLEGVGKLSVIADEAGALIGLIEPWQEKPLSAEMAC